MENHKFPIIEILHAMTSRHWEAAGLAVLLLIAGAARVTANAPDFNSEVRPILSTKCFKCHGPDDKTREAGARLDVRDAALRPAKSGKAPIVPGNTEQSEIVRRIFSDKHDLVMPPPAAKIEMTPEQKDILKRWVAAGAKYEPHWAFVPPKSVSIPRAVEPNTQRAHPIDAFVLARLEREGLKPSPPADPYVLARRIHLDLIGLPPTPEEADAFVADSKHGLPNAVATLADKLLASPHYGERWARRWLDLAMYADTNGYEKDRPRSIWPYRDWVINALNADLPFDQFSILQIAGDMVPENELPDGQTATDAKVATGFFRNTMINEEGGIDPLEYRFAAMTTRMHMTGAAWLGLTLQCAQCHTHKFDPITQHEYYGLMAFLNNADEPDLDLPSDDTDDRDAERAERAVKLLAALPDQWPLPPKSDAKPVRPSSVVAASGQEPVLLEDDSALFAGEGPATDSYTISFDSPEATVHALRLDALTDDKLPSKGPGRVAHGNFVLTGITLTAAPKDEPGKAVPVKIARATTDTEQDKFPITGAFDGDPRSGWAVHTKGGKLNTPKSAIFYFDEPIRFPGGTRFVVKLDQHYGNQHTLGRVRLGVVSPGEAGIAEEKPRDIAEREFLRWLVKQRSQRSNWTTIAPVHTRSNLPFLEVQPDHSVLASGDITKHDTYELKFVGDFTGVRAIRLEALPDDSLPNHGPGLTYYEGPKGDFFMGEFTVAVAGATQMIAAASQSYAKNNFGDRAVSAMAATDGDLQTGWSCAGRSGERHEAVFNFAAPLGDAKELTVKMDFGRHYACPLGRFRLAVSRDERAPVATDVPDEISALFAVADDKLTTEQRQQLREYFLMTAPALTAGRKDIVNLRKPAKSTTTMVLRERPAKNPRPTPLYHRGEFMHPKETVAPATLAVLPPLAANQPRNRLGFAHWIVSRENPLTARVVVNREWGAFFGDGLVRTVADFGYQGEVPTHPELLDWLALEFVKQGWSLKKLHRLIVTSSTYQQSSAIPRPLYARDPQNRLLARGPRFRVEAEYLRDSALRASGQLTTKLGGPSVFPPQPAGVTTEGTYGSFGWGESAGEDRYRRALYTFSKRTAPYAMFNTFDGPSGEACVAKREVSNSALQSLTTLNDKVFIEAAQALGNEFARSQTEPFARITALFRRCLTRPPTDEEVDLLTHFYESQRQMFAANEAEAKKLAGDGNNAAERAAWTATARAILNLDEFVTKE